MMMMMMMLKAKCEDSFVFLSVIPRITEWFSVKFDIVNYKRNCKAGLILILLDSKTIF